MSEHANSHTELERGLVRGAGGQKGYLVAGIRKLIEDLML